MPDNTFDIVSKIDLQEVSNAIQQAMKEITTRFDLKDSKSSIALEGKEAIVLHSVDEYKLKAINDILQQKLVKRGVPLKGLKLRNDRVIARRNGKAESHHAARNSDREGARYREGNQRLEEEGSGFNPGRLWYGSAGRTATHCRK